MLYSFDIFDTCIGRVLLYPKDVHRAVAYEYLAQSESKKNNEATVRALAQLRIKKERQWHEERAGKEPLLEDILRTYPEELHGVPLNPSLLYELEVQIDKRVSFLIAHHAERIAELRKQGASIVFISDMYHSVRVIRSLLERHCLIEEGDKLYVSSEWGTTKRDGTLFLDVAKDLDVSPRVITHWGDNKRADFLQGRRRGLKAYWWRDGSHNRYERPLYSDDELESADFLFQSKFIGVSRACRLMAPGEVQGSDLFYNVGLPLLVSFVRRLLSQAHERNIEKLLFVSRDGQVFMRIAESLEVPFAKPELVYFYSSRQALFFATIDELKKDKLEWLLLGGQSRCLRDVLKRLSLSLKEVSDCLKKYELTSFWDRALPENRTADFWEMIESADFHLLLKERMQQACMGLKAYFLEMGLDHGKRYAFVDVGWHLRMQAALSRFIEDEFSDGAIPEPFGFYCGVNTFKANGIDASSYDAYFEEASMELDGSSFFKNSRLIEEVFTANVEAQLVGYQPVAGSCELLFSREKRKNAKHIELLAKRDDSLERYLKMVNEHLADYWNDSIAREIVARNVRLFFDNPYRREALMLVGVTAGDDQNEANEVSLVEPFTFTGLFRYSLGRIRGEPVRLPAWKMGAVKASNLFLRIVFRCIFKGIKLISK